MQFEVTGPTFDRGAWNHVDLTIIPLRASEEDIHTIAQSLLAMPDALAWPGLTDELFRGQRGSEGLGQGLSAADHPAGHSLRKFDVGFALVDGRVPSTSVRQAARRAFGTMSDYCDAHCPAEKWRSRSHEHLRCRVGQGALPSP